MRLSVSLTQEKVLPGLSLLFLKKVIRTTLITALPVLATKEVRMELSLASVSDEAIAALNTTYRQKKAPTDILSFGNFECVDEVLVATNNTISLGQLVVSPDYIRRSAQEDGVSWKHELVFVLVHGVLHLLGYDHSEKMFEIQDTVTAELMRQK